MSTNKIDAILFDNGGVLQGPLSGNWLLSPQYKEILGRDLTEREARLMNEFIDSHLELLPEAMPVKDEAEEERLYTALYSKAFEAAGMALDAETISLLSRDMTYSNERVFVFDDVFEWLEKLAGEFTLGLLSDATPSSRRIVYHVGMNRFFSSETYSYELGVTKPDERMFSTAISRMGIAPERILFVDDSPVNLDGAARLGLKCVQMRRASGAPKTPHWDAAHVECLKDVYEYAIGL